MFDLQKAIADWRRRMLAAGIETPVPLEELETHLRDEIAERIAGGATEAEAFEAAVADMGRADAVQAEFTKFEMERDGWAGLAKWLRISVVIVSWFILIDWIWGVMRLVSGVAAPRLVGLGPLIGGAMPLVNRTAPWPWLAGPKYFLVGLFVVLVVILLPLVPWWRSTAAVRGIGGFLFLIASCLVIYADVVTVRHGIWLRRVPAVNILQLASYTFQICWFLVKFFNVLEKRGNLLEDCPGGRERARGAGSRLIFVGSALMLCLPLFAIVAWIISCFHPRIYYTEAWFKVHGADPAKLYQMVLNAASLDNISTNTVELKCSIRTGPHSFHMVGNISANTVALKRLPEADYLCDIGIYNPDSQRAAEEANKLMFAVRDMILAHSPSNAPLAVTIGREAQPARNPLHSKADKIMFRGVGAGSILALCGLDLLIVGLVSRSSNIRNQPQIA